MSVDQLSFPQLSLSPNHPPSIVLTKDPTRSRKTRNREYVPSDDEDEDALTEDEDDTDTYDTELHLVNKRLPSPPTSTIPSRKQQHKKVTPLPSDDEEEEDSNFDGDVYDSEDDDNVQFHLNDGKSRVYRLQGVLSTSQLGNYIPKSSSPVGQAQRHSADESNVKDPSSYSADIPSYDSDDDCALLSQQKFSSCGSVSGGNDTFLTHGSQLQQWQSMQQHHQTQMAQFNHRQQQHHHHHHHQRHYQHPHQPHPTKSHSSSSHLRYRSQQQQQQQPLSGMELMAQLEQDKAEAKRQKPKLNPTHAKIQGLLAKLPEQGAHNISFQHVYQQQQQQHHFQKHRQQHRQQQHGFNRATTVGRSSSPTPSTRSCAPNMMMTQQQQQSLMAGPYSMHGYPLPSYYHQQQQQQPCSRSGSAMSMNRP